jgi:hypothetical protein
MMEKRRTKMSHNKDIRYLHEVTGESYAVCRQKMKAAHWDLFKALVYPSVDEILEKLKPVIEVCAEAVVEIAKVVGNFIESIDWNELGRLAAEAKAMEADLDPDNYEYNPETGYFERREVTNENERHT